MSHPRASLSSSPLRGVNLGNWLLLERWMRPKLFAGTRARDEYTLCETLGTGAEKHLLNHRDTFVTEADFVWLRERGINALRIPFGYWHFAPEAPFVASPWHLDWAVDMAAKHGMQVLLDLHGLPGSQGPNDHTGRAGFFRWHKDRRYVERSLDIVETIAARYAGRAAVTGFSVVNEPEPVIGRDALVSFHEEAHDRVRRHMRAHEVAFVVAAYPEGELPVYHGCLGDRENVVTDVHLYQNFGDWSAWTLADYLAYPLTRQAKLRPHLAAGPVIVGEWSLSIAEPILKQLAAMAPFRQRMVRQMHAHMLLAMLEEFAGWYFWSYRADDRPDWSFRDAVELGLLPDDFSDAGLEALAVPKTA